MKKNTINEMLEILTAYKEGKEIELYGESKQEWVVILNPLWDFSNKIYRIKPDQKIKKLVPFDFDDDLLGKVIKYKTSPIKGVIVGQDDVNVLINNKVASYKFLLDYYTFMDGSRCGKYIEQ